MSKRRTIKCQKEKGDELEKNKINAKDSGTTKINAQERKRE